MFVQPANRWQAFGIHILISLFLFLVLASIIYFCWYPGFLFLHDGGIDGMKLIAGVDFFIGPVLTLCVYKLGKKSLPFDLAVIAVLQVACLLGGMWTVWKTRPVAVVYSAGAFATTNVDGYSGKDIDTRKIPLLQVRWPVWLGVDLSDEKIKQLKAKWVIMGAGLEYQTDSYVPYEKMLSDMAVKGLRAADTQRDDIKALEKLESENPSVRFFPIVTTETTKGLLAVDIKTGKDVAFF